MFLDQDMPVRELHVNSNLFGVGGIPSYQQLQGQTNYYYYLSQYEGEISYLDWHFGRLMEAMRQSGLYENSVIIVTADHGECMGGHDYYFCHSENLYNGLVNVPLIMRHGSELCGRRKDYVQHIDIVPTIYSILGISPDAPLRGRDLRNRADGDRELFFEMDSRDVPQWRRFGLLFGGMKLIYSSMARKWELYDIASDPRELVDLAERPDYAKGLIDMKERLQRLTNEDLLKVRFPGKQRKLTKEEAEALKSLGYVE
jgi:arylsulfatase A-like enzyme